MRPQGPFLSSGIPRELILLCTQLEAYGGNLCVCWGGGVGRGGARSNFLNQSLRLCGILWSH